MCEENETKLSEELQLVHEEVEEPVPSSPYPVEEEIIEKGIAQNVESPGVPESPSLPEFVPHPMVMMAAPSRKDRFPKDSNKSLEKKDSKEKETVKSSET